MKKLFIFLFAIVSLHNSNAQWTAQESGITNNLNDVFFISDTGYIVGDNGCILKTIDGGNHWFSLASGTTSSLFSVYFTDKTTGYVVGNDGVILKTINGGIDWTLQSSGTINHLSYICFTSIDTGYSVGYNGTILKTINGGENWIVIQSGTTANLKSFYFPALDKGFIVGDEGIILKTINGGLNWTILKSGDNWIVNYSSYFGLSLCSIFFKDSLNGFSIANAYTYYINAQIIRLVYFLRTNDGGLTWYGSQVMMENASSFYFTDSDTAYIVGKQGSILGTSDEGINWISQNSGTTETLNSLYFTNSHTGYIVGENGIILKNTNTTQLIEERNMEEAINIFPNHVNNKLTIEILKIEKEWMLTIIDINGRELIKQKIIDSKTQIDISNLTCGVYLVKVSNNNSVSVRKIIKE